MMTSSCKVLPGVGWAMEVHVGIAVRAHLIGARVQRAGVHHFSSQDTTAL